jgi:hypothetical protein
LAALILPSQAPLRQPPRLPLPSLLGLVQAPQKASLRSSRSVKDRSNYPTVHYSVVLVTILSLLQASRSVSLGHTLLGARPVLVICNCRCLVVKEHPSHGPSPAPSPHGDGPAGLATHLVSSLQLTS